MVNVKMRGLKVYSVGGKWYVYVRATGVALVKNFSGTKADLLKLLETPEIMGAYNAKRIRAMRSYPRHTLGWLVAWFTDPEFTDPPIKCCEHFKKLAPATQDKYKECLSCLDEVYDAPLSDLRTHDIVLWRDKVEKDKWPAFADRMVTVLSTMFGLAAERGWMDSNIAQGIRRTYKSDKNANREWLPAEWAVVMDRAPTHLKIAYMLARYVGYRSQSVVAVQWSNYQPDPRFGMCFRMTHKKNSELHWIPASPELQSFLADIKVRTAKGQIAVRFNGQPWESAEQLQKQSSNFLGKLTRDGLVGPGLTEHGLRVTFACEIKRVTGANDDQVAAALGDRDARMGDHYTRHVEQEARIIEVFFAKQMRTRTEQDLSKREGSP
jgi:integrase